VIPYEILDRKRRGEALPPETIAEVVAGAASGSWSDVELAAFLMAAAIQGLDDDETASLTLGMRDSGECWSLAGEIPGVCDKHSTGGVGDKLSLVLSPILAACGVPVAMLTGRALGHTGGTADKLETIPGIDIALDREGCLASIERFGFAIGMSTAAIAPADKRLYALRSLTGTVESRQLITASICSKKLALGAANLVFDVKVGNGAFLESAAEAETLARGLVTTCRSLGINASALLTDMNQPLGEWSGDRAEVWESIELLAGRMQGDSLEVTLLLCEELARLAERPLGRSDLERVIASGEALERFRGWVIARGGDWDAVATPKPQVGAVETRVVASRSGVLARVETKKLGLLLRAVGGGGGRLDPGVAWRRLVRLGEAVREGETLGCLYSSTTPAAEVVRDLPLLFEVADDAVAPALVHRHVV
jgi:pyrimidine-nucleoside phosphorylase